jgi:uncharacterized MAPEG superfamily protein
VVLDHTSFKFATLKVRPRHAYTDYNAGPRKQPSPHPVGIVTGWLQRAQDNLIQTLPLFAAAVLVAHVGGRDGALTLWGARFYLISRIVYVPLYAMGVPVIRSIVWSGGLIGLLLILFAVLRPL